MAKDQTFDHPPRGHVGLLAYDPDNDRFQVVHVDEDGQLQVDVAASEALEAKLYGWDGSAWEKVRVDEDGYLEVKLPLVETTTARNYQYDGSDWRKSNLLWGFHDTVSELMENYD